MSSKPVKTALIGSGSISCTYLDNMVNRFGILDVIGCSDLIGERSQRRAEQFGIRNMTNEEILGDPEIEIVVNTTYPISHYKVTKEALLAGKNVHCEKMMASTFEEAKELVALAGQKGLRLGMAPDTFLGAGYQTCRKLIDAGFIGRPVNVQALVARGYHYDFPQEMTPPPFVFNAGGTIPYDMGGYYMHAMVSLLGPVRRVAGFARADAEKTFSHPFHPRYGEKLNLEHPTHLQVSLEFEAGVYGSLTVIGESTDGETTRLEIYGTHGTLVCPDPNTYGGPVLLMRKGMNQFMEIPLTHGYVTDSEKNAALSGNAEADNWRNSRRGIGVADMAWAMRNGRPHRCSAELGLHAMEIIHGALHATTKGEVYTMTTHPLQPAALPSGYTGSDAEACLDN